MLIASHMILKKHIFSGPPYPPLQNKSVVKMFDVVLLNSWCSVSQSVFLNSNPWGKFWKIAFHGQIILENVFRKIFFSPIGIFRVYYHNADSKMCYSEVIFLSLFRIGLAKCIWLWKPFSIISMTCNLGMLI